MTRSVPEGVCGRAHAVSATRGSTGNEDPPHADVALRSPEGRRVVHSDDLCLESGVSVRNDMNPSVRCARVPAIEIVSGPSGVRRGYPDEVEGSLRSLVFECRRVK